MSDSLVSSLTVLTLVRIRCENEEGGECSFRGTFAAAMAHGDLCWDRAVTLDYISCALGFDLPEDWRTDDGLERILEGIRLCEYDGAVHATVAKD